MSEKIKKSKLAIFKDFRSPLILVVAVAITASITYILYSYTQQLLKERLQERLIAIATTAAIQFDPAEIESIQTLEDSEKIEFSHLVHQLKGVKDSNSNIQYAYLMRRTSNPDIFSFVADAESLTPIEELDFNEDGVLQDDEAAPMPGDEYDVSEFNVLRDEAFYKAAADQDLESDQWSVQLSAYAPIRDANGNAVAIFGIDVLVNDYLKITQATFLPFLLFILFLLFLLTLLTILLVRFWNAKVEAVQELDQQKDELLSIVSHQLATPVSSVKWYLEMMKDGDLGPMNEEQLKHVTSMQEVAVNLSDLVSMILDVSRIQLGRMHIEKQELDLNGFFKEILEIIEPKALEKKVNLVKKLPATLPVAQLDKRYTHMTIENLLSNAIKYTPEGGEVDFTVTIEGNMLKCIVKDTGVGIPEADKDKIFGKLFRASNVRNTVDGNGFGLYVAKGAVEAQGGKIRFESIESKGTTFFVELPLS